MLTFLAASGARPLPPAAVATIRHTPAAAAMLTMRMMNVMYPGMSGIMSRLLLWKGTLAGERRQPLEIAPHRVPASSSQPVGDMPLRLLPERDRWRRPPSGPSQ